MIRWITAELGTAPATSPEIGADIARVDVRDLVDKHGNTPDAVLVKIEDGVRLLQEGKRVVVCCDYGISRSNAVASGILSRFLGIPLTAAIKEVSRATGEKEIKLEPLLVVREALSGPDAPRSKGGRTLVTGGSGFIAGHLRRTEGSDALFDYVSSRDFDLSEGAVHLDLAMRDHGADQILHLANPRVYTSNRAMGDTLAMLRNVLEVCRSTGARLIYLSSWELYSGYRASRLLADETLPALPKGPYGETKLLCERLIEHHRTHHGLDCAIIRSAPVFGEGSDKPKFLYNFVQRALSGQHDIRTHRYRNGFPALDLLDVRDLARLIVQVARERAAGDFNVGGGTLFTTSDIARMVVEECGGTARVEHVDIADDVASIAMDSTRASAVLGWHPEHAFADGLKAIVARAR